MLEDGEQRIYLRANITKNRKDDTLPLVSLPAEILKELKAQSAGENLVIGMLPRMCVMKTDWKAAGIEYKDKDGKTADFHSLRKTCCTMLQTAGVPPRIVQKIMRHSDPRLTNMTYTDDSQFDTRKALERIPIENKCPQIGAQTIVQRGLELSFTVAADLADNNLQVVDDGLTNHDL